MQTNKFRKNISFFILITISITYLFLPSDTFAEEESKVIGVAQKQSFETVANELSLIKDISALGSIELESTVFAVVFSQGGKFLITADERGGIRLWDTKKNYALDTVLEGHTKKIFSLDLSKDGKYLASAGKDQLIKIWDLSNKQLVKTIRDYKGSITAVVFSPDNTILASSNLENVIEFWATKEGEFYHVTDLTGIEESIYSMAFSPNSAYLVSAGKDKEITIRPLGVDDKKKVLHNHTHVVLSVSFSPRGRFLASGGADNVANLWKIKFAKKRLQIAPQPAISYVHRGWVTKVKFSPDEKFFITASQSGDLRIWDLAKMKLIKIINVFSEKPIFDFSFSPQGRYLAVAGKGAVIIYDWQQISSN
ncbi:MAG: WD40 repeat domain-containing protein [Candidatus Omnitrophota bacterium]|nr:MAG: WD40 repeat domain-containing protein [Candidatus Omnitrophota bacterium]